MLSTIARENSERDFTAASRGIAPASPPRSYRCPVLVLEPGRIYFISRECSRLGDVGRASDHRPSVSSIKRFHADARCTAPRGDCRPGKQFEIRAARDNRLRTAISFPLLFFFIGRLLLRAGDLTELSPRICVESRSARAEGDAVPSAARVLKREQLALIIIVLVGTERTAHRRGMRVFVVRSG